MYNLFVSGNPDDWAGDPWQIEKSRCVREYTNKDLIERFGELDTAAISELQKLPCIFAYETACDVPAKFGLIRDIIQRQGNVRVTYELQDVDPFITADGLLGLAFELDIGKWELNRTHWAVKDVNLPMELRRQRIILPEWTRTAGGAIDVSTHSFEVGLSFPGEAREFVVQVAERLEGFLGPNTYFYDENYVAQLARPQLDTLLQDIYRNRSKLVVVFIGADYQNKNWCGTEWRAIREIIHERDNQRIMLVRMDDGDVDGIFRNDGYVDARRFSPADVASFINERVELLARAN